MHIDTEFGTVLPEKVIVEKGQKKIIVANTIQNGEVSVEENSELTLVMILTKGWEDKKILNLFLDGENSKITFLAFIIARDSEEFKFETISNHQVEKTEAYYHVRAAMFDKSKVYYKGNLNIDKGGQITNTYLSHDTLMLSKDARVETIPSLEIEADDVKAGHAATVRRIDEEMLFYLASRGIGQKEAEEMLIKGFMEATLDLVPDESTRRVIIDNIENALPGHIK